MSDDNSDAISKERFVLAPLPLIMNDIGDQNTGREESFNQLQSNIAVSKPDCD